MMGSTMVIIQSITGHNSSAVTICPVHNLHASQVPPLVTSRLHGVDHCRSRDHRQGVVPLVTCQAVKSWHLLRVKEGTLRLVGYYRWLATEISRGRTMILATRREVMIDCSACVAYHRMCGVFMCTIM